MVIPYITEVLNVLHHHELNNGALDMLLVYGNRSYKASVVYE
jgi:hypothetical protein